MRPGLLGSALLAILSTSSPAQTAKPAAPPSNAIAKTLIALEQQSWSAWKQRDSSFYRSFLSDDHIEMGAGGPSNKTQVLATVATPACIVHSFHTDQFHVAVLSSTAAVVTYHASQETTCNGARVPSPAWVSSVYVYRKGKWENAVYQQTPSPQ